MDSIAMLLQQSIEPVSIVYTCSTYCVMHWFQVHLSQKQDSAFTA